MAHSRVADGGNGLEIWVVAENILNKQLHNCRHWKEVALQLGGWVRG